jgi:hypothetical protein
LTRSSVSLRNLRPTSPRRLTMTGTLARPTCFCPSECALFMPPSSPGKRHIHQAAPMQLHRIYNAIRPKSCKLNACTVQPRCKLPAEIVQPATFVRDGAGAAEDSSYFARADEAAYGDWNIGGRVCR